MKELFVLVVFIFITIACQQYTSKIGEHDKSVQISCHPKSDLSYAQGFTIEETGVYSYLTVFNPWNKDTLSTYLLLKDSVSKTPMPVADFIVNLPLKKISCLSSSGIGMLIQLKSGHLISATTDAEFIYDSILYKRYLDGNLENLGKTTNLNTEVIVEHNPDLIIKYIYGGKELADSRLKDAGIPIA